MNIFAKNLKDLRKNNELSQSEFAERLGLKFYTIGNWEQGRSEPSMDDLILISNTFNVSIDYLVGRTDDEYAVPTVPQTEDLSARERELLSEFRRLGPFEAEAILIQIKALAGEKAPAIKK